MEDVASSLWRQLQHSHWFQLVHNGNTQFVFVVIFLNGQDNESFSLSESQNIKEQIQ